jgi:hypothetical protein
MDDSALRDEILKDPEKIGYAPAVATGSANQVADLLNAPRYDGLGKVEITPVLIWLAKYGVMARLRAAVNGADPSIASIAEVALLLVQNPNIPALDVGLSDVQMMLGALVQADVIPEDAAAELSALAAVRQSRAEVLGLGVVTADDVSRTLAEV